MNKSEQINELAAALSQFQHEVKPAVMGSVNPFLKNKYADLGAVIEAAKEPLHKNGLSYTQLVTGSGTQVGVETVIMHKSGQYVSGLMTMEIGAEKGKAQAQVAGSIISYLRRYSLASGLGLYSDEENDGSSTTTGKPAATTTGKAPAATKTTTGKKSDIAGNAAAGSKRAEFILRIGVLKTEAEDLGIDVKNDNIEISKMNISQIEKYGKSLAALVADKKAVLENAGGTDE